MICLFGQCFVTDDQLEMILIMAIVFGLLMGLPLGMLLTRFYWGENVQFDEKTHGKFGPTDRMSEKKMRRKFLKKKKRRNF